MGAYDLLDVLDTPANLPTEVCCETALPLEDAAKIAALEKLYPQHSQESLISFLLHHALSNIQTPINPG